MNPLLLFKSAGLSVMLDAIVEDPHLYDGFSTKSSIAAPDVVIFVAVRNT